MAKRLIVCADDFGMSAGVNEGIIRAHREGILTDASLMAGGAAFDEAAALARAHPQLSVGVHLVLVQGRAVAPSESIPGLVDAGGMFRRNPISTGLRDFFLPGLHRQLRIEISAQIEKVLAAGLCPSHLNGHLHMHMHPAVIGLVTELARRYDIGSIRLSRERLRPALRFDRRRALRKASEAVIFRVMSAYAKQRFVRPPLTYAENLFGLHQTGHVTEAYLLHLLPQLPAGVTEIYCHPGLWDDESHRWRPPDYEPEAELAALLSPRVRACIGRLGIEPTTCRELARERRCGVSLAS